MGNVKICKTFVNPTVYYASSEDPNLPKTNAVDRSFPLRPFRTQSASNEVLRISVPTTRAIKGIYIRHTNCNTIQIRTSANSVNFPGGSAVDLVIGPVKDSRVNRYNYITTAATSGASLDTMNSTDPYWEFTFMGTNNTNDGNSYYFVGCIYLFTDLFQIIHEEQFPFNVRRVRPTLRSQRPSASASFITVGYEKVYITIPLVLQARADSDNPVGGETQIWDIGSVIPEEGFILWENRERDNNERYSRAYHVVPAGDIEVRYEQTDAVIATSLELEEVT